MRIRYTDPAWALPRSGQPEPARATIEREVFGSHAEIGLGVTGSGRFILQGSEFQHYLRGADAVVVYRCQVTEELLAAAGPGCRVVARQGVGLDNLNADLLRQAGIWGFHVPDYCGDEVATHALALTLAVERGVCVQDQLVKSGRWSIHGGRIPRRLSARCAGIVGFGRIGRASCHKLRACYGRVLAYDPYVPADVMASHGVTRCDDLATLVGECDAVVLHAELTDETREIINAAALARCRPGMILVNVARGGLVELSAVVAALESGKLGGFASDVFSPENPNDSPMGRTLLAMPNVVVSAHRAFLSAESEESLRRRVAEGVRHVLVTGSPPPLGRVA
jgi:D-3-phosphoglycerate dehydrogenase